MASTKPSEDPSVLVAPTTTLDGSPEIADAQVVAVGVVTGGPSTGRTIQTLGAPGVGAQMYVKDATAPLGGGTAIGVSVTTQDTPVIAALTNANSIREVSLRHAGVLVDAADRRSSRIWLGIGVAAVVGEGDFLDPGDAWLQRTSQAIHAIVNTGVPNQLLAGQEYVA